MGDPRRPDLTTAGGPPLDDSLAKADPDESYRGHVTDVYRAWRGLSLRHAGLIARVAGRHGLSADRLLRSSLLCVALHDLGKLSENFQRMMRAASPPRDEAGYHDAVLRNVRHEVIAVPVVHLAAGRLAKACGPLSHDLPPKHRGLLETLAVAGHHKYLAECSLMREERFLNGVDWPRGDPVPPLRAGLELAAAMFAECGWDFPLADPSPKVEARLRRQTAGHMDGLSAGFSLLNDHLARAAPDAPAAAVRRHRELFALLKGLLMTADWMASGGEPDAAGAGAVAAPSAGVLPYLRGKTGVGDLKFNDLQRRCRDADGHLLMVSPTGRGKTEAALLWALRQAERGHVRKVLFLLPTMVTANGLHERLEAFFTERHGQAVGLTHSTADLVLADRAGAESEADRGEVRRTLLGPKHFFHPVTAATVDQLLATLLHGGRWPMKTLAAADAAVVVDEVHAYDPHTAGLVTLLIEHLAPLGTRFCVMSATLPDDLKETLRASLGGPDAVTEVIDSSLDHAARNTWELHDGPLTGWATDGDGPSAAFHDLMDSTNDRGRPTRVLVVVNTVKRCQDLAEALLEYRPTCLHSKFIFRDRRGKEQEIMAGPPRLLIATQVVEVSLDLDYDVLLTECAPADALVQRAGRVNRPRRDVPGRVVVYRPEEGSDKVYGEPRGVLGKTWETLSARCGGAPAWLTEADLKAVTEAVYAGRRLRDEAAYKGVRAEVRELQDILGGVLDHPLPEGDTERTRLETYKQVEAIPERFEAAARAAPPPDRRLWELKVPLWYFRQPGIGRGGGEELPVVVLKSYDRHLGAVLEDTGKSPGHPLPPGSQFC